MCIIGWSATSHLELSGRGGEGVLGAWRLRKGVFKV